MLIFFLIILYVLVCVFESYQEDERKWWDNNAP